MHVFIAVVSLGVITIVINALRQNMVLMIKTTCDYYHNVVMYKPQQGRVKG